MYTLLISLAIFVAFLLVLVILAQNSKGGGLTSQFGGSGASNLIGIKKTGDLLERLTMAFAFSIIIISLGTNLVNPATDTQSDEILDRVNQQGQVPNTSPIQQPADTSK